MANLERRVGAIPDSAVQHAVMSGRAFRLLRSPSGCASSVLLIPDQLRRLFGGHDQMLAAPGRHILLSFSIEMPTIAAAQIAVDIEQDELAPLFLGPFLLSDGTLIWDDVPDDLDAETLG